MKLPHFKSFVIYLLIFSFAVIGFTGCRSKENQVQTDFSGITLTYYKIGVDSEIIKPIIQKYVASHHGLQINYKKFTNFDEYQRSIVNEMAEGGGPDIFSMPNTWFISNYKKLTPMPAVLGTAAGIIADFQNVFVDVASKNLITTDTKGIEQVYGLPMTVDSLALYYNNSDFEDRIPQTGKPATTWEGIKQNVMLLNKASDTPDKFAVSGIAMGLSDNISMAVDILYMLFLQYGVQFYDTNLSQAIFASKQNGAYSYPAIEALKFFISFADKSQQYYSWNENSADATSPGKELDAFAKGEVSMIMGYSGTYGAIMNEISVLKSQGVKTISPDSVRTAPIPQLYDPKVSSEKRITYANYYAETVSRNSKHANLAWDFLIFLTSRENLSYYFDKTHKPTSRRDMIEDQKKDPVYGVFAGQTGYAESFSVIDSTIYKTLFSDLITRAVSGGVDKSGLVNVQDAISAMLPSGGVVVPKAKEQIDQKL